MDDGLQSRPFSEEIELLNRSLLNEGDILSGNYWAELRVFLAIAKAKSFNRAAEKLGVSAATVARNVRRLQDVMKTELFVSGASGVQMTSAGVDLAVLLARLDVMLHSITDQLGGVSGAPEGTVRITITEGITIGLLDGPLMDLSDKFPNISVVFQNPRNINDFRQNNADMMISLSSDPGTDVVCRKLGTLHLVTAASTRYIARYGMPTLANLEKHRFVQCPYYGAGNGFWDPWNKLARRGRIAHSCENALNYGLMAKAGHGIALLSSFCILERSMRPLDLGLEIKAPLYGIARVDALCRPANRVVFEWLCDMLSSANPWLGDTLSFDHEDDPYSASFRFLFNND